MTPDPVPDKLTDVVVDFLTDWRYCPLASSPNPSRACLEDTARQLLDALAARGSVSEENAREWDLDPASAMAYEPGSFNRPDLVRVREVRGDALVAAPSRPEGDEEAVERVAKAIFASDSEDDDEKWEDFLDDSETRREYRNNARAAIAAFREPVARGETE